MSETPAPPSLARLAIDRTAPAVSRRRRPLWKRWWVWALVAALVVVAGLVLRSRSAPQQVEFATVAAAYPSTSVAILNATGRVVAQRRASVSSKGTGRLEWLGVQEGQMVQEGDVIARLENRDVAAQREQAAAQVQAARANLAQGQAELDDAQAALKRAQDLARQNFISGSALDTAEARYNKARAQIDTLKAQIGVAEANLRVASVGYDQTLIRAPFTGIVLTKSANVGDIVTPFSSASGTTGAVVTMADMETLEVEADVSESSIAKIKVGQPAEVQLDAFPDLRLLGEVSRVVPTVDRSKATLLVKVKFVEHDPRVLPDMSAKIAFLSRALKPEERKPVPALRPDAVVKRDGADVVFVVEAAGAVKPVPVKTGDKVGDLVRVEGVAPGTRVVANPPERLAAGSRVEAAKK
ncbi:MAG TPA: efflux RND transporter periplasmic adaptor subunit [Burkholderiaceae bacterium]|nr:efflux RND transporter periplasmic adaptor subunit [Burkholderiaceae bacterium]HQR77333.1 efflux RND transporter periplasmic adaptor subunit [Burkholderiaceae bacterium]